METKNFRRAAQDSLDEIDEQLSSLQYKIDHSYDTDAICFQTILNECRIDMDALIEKYNNLGYGDDEDLETRLNSFKKSRDLLRDKIAHLSQDLTFST